MVTVLTQILDSLLINLVTPMAARTGDVDGVVETLKKSVVYYAVERSEQGKETLAKHFAKSDRWVYRFLREGRQGSDERQPQRLVERVSGLFEAAYPRALSANDCVGLLREQGIRISWSDLEPLLKVYCELGLLGRIEDEPGLYRALRSAPEAEGLGNIHRVYEIGERARSLVPAALSYALEDQGACFDELQGLALRHHFEDAAADCQAYIRQRMAQAYADSEAEDPHRLQGGNWVDYSGAFAMGLGHADGQGEAFMGWNAPAECREEALEMLYT